ncbi:helix-turn-helix DNA binding domain protein [Arthrobacter phage Bauer]|uniref:Helix-turn-helix DNA binding domain protein n=1 Tax=Arthrobacter phage Bauer TaxID=2985648 RepID=A0A9E7V2L6_9CAUD|nr:helix-turn-helix DNA binding domain protein [Arthrobacter phage Bauer]UYM26593.1 helix-turn-helix DNA binding domain protein [Arthrobacter phage Bauer]
MGTENDRIWPVITQNIEQALKNQGLNRNALADKSRIPKSTLYRNIEQPEKFTGRELGQIAEALGLPLEALITAAA